MTTQAGMSEKLYIGFPRKADVHRYATPAQTVANYRDISAAAFEALPDLSDVPFTTAASDHQAAQAAEHNASQAALLYLPAEVRRLIWEHYLASWEAERGVIGLIYACKQTRHEVLPLWVTKHHFGSMYEEPYDLNARDVAEDLSLFSSIRLEQMEYYTNVKPVVLMLLHDDAGRCVGFDTVQKVFYEEIWRNERVAPMTQYVRLPLLLSKDGERLVDLKGGSPRSRRGLMVAAAAHVWAGYTLGKDGVDLSLDVIELMLQTMYDVGSEDEFSEF